MNGRMKDEVVMIGIVWALILVILPVLAYSAGERGPIKIGYLIPTSGPQAELAKYMGQGFELYLAKVNYQVAGRKIEVLYEDDKFDPRTGMIKAKRLVEEKKVHMVAGVIASHVAYAIKDYLTTNKIPFIINNASGENITSRDFSPYVFRTSFSSTQAPHVFADWLYKKGHRRLVVIGPDYSYGHEAVGAFCKVFTDAGGEIVDEFYFPLNTMDFAPYLAKISGARVDGVMGVASGSDALRLTKQYAEFGVKGKIPLFSLAIITDELISEAGDSGVGMVDCFQAHFNEKGPSFLKTREHNEFVESFKNKFGKGPNITAESGYAGAQLIVKGLELIGGKVEDTDAFVKAMEKVDMVAPRGPFKLDKFHNPIQNEYISVIKKKGSEYYFELIETYPNVSQFWKWTPEEFMKRPSYKDTKGTWGKKN